MVAISTTEALMFKAVEWIIQWELKKGSSSSSEWFTQLELTVRKQTCIARAIESYEDA